MSGLLQSIFIALVTAAAAWPVAYFAAKFAFLLQVGREKKREDDENVANANKAILRFIEARRNVLAYAERLNAPHVTPQNQHFAVVPAASPIESLRVNLDSLVFLLGGSTPNLLYDLSSSIAEINSTIEFISARDQMHFEFQRKTGDKLFGSGQNVDLNAVEAAAGPFYTRILTQMTADMSDHIKQAVLAAETSIAGLHSGTKTLYPSHKVIFLKAQPKPKSNSAKILKPTKSRP